MVKKAEKKTNTQASGPARVSDRLNSENTRLSELFKSFSNVDILFNDIHFQFTTDIRLLPPDIGASLVELEKKLGVIFNSRFSPEERPILHSHMYYELFAVCDGECDFHLRDRSVHLKKNDCCIVAPGVYHHLGRESEKGAIFNIGFVYEKKQTDSGFYRELDKAIGKIEFEARSDASELCDAICSLRDCINKNEYLKNCRMKLIYDNIIYLTVRVFGKNDEPNDDSVSSFVTNNIYHIDKINYLLYNFYMYDLTLELISEALYLSPRQISRIIKKEYNLTYKEKLIEVRIQNFIKLRKETDLPTEKLAAYVGYNSMNGFYHAFKKHTGTTPAEYASRMGK